MTRADTLTIIQVQLSIILSRYAEIQKCGKIYASRYHWTSIKDFTCIPSFCTKHNRSGVTPVSLLCILSSVFEKVMYNRLIYFLETYKILVKFQFGFRKFHSTYMALMTLMDKSITALENGEHVIGIFSFQRPSIQLIMRYC